MQAFDMLQERTLGDLTKDAVTHLGDMVRNEIKLAKAEASDGIHAMSGGLAIMIAGASIAAAALTMVLFALAYGLSETMPMWQAALVAAAIGGALALVLVLAGRATMKPKQLALPKTRDQVARDINTISEHVPS
jgi:membrane protein implicated in regulation of membrane protease activity